MINRLVRPLAATFLLIGGAVHYNLWRGGYRHIPKIGPLFLGNVIGSVILALAVLSSHRISVYAAGIAFATGSLAALVLSRTVGVFGFTEMIWTPQAVKTLTSELGAILALALAVTLQLRRTHEAQARLAPIAARPRTTPHSR